MLLYRRAPARPGAWMPHVLIAEDEDRIADFIQRGLRAQGYRTTIVTDGVTASEQARSGRYELLILGLRLPRRDGHAVLADLRDSGVPLPVIILSARGSVQDIVAGLEGGADDYMTKPFRFEELLARARVRLRAAAPPTGTEPTTLTVGGLSLNLRTRGATNEGRTVQLSAREFALLEMFMRCSGEVLSREQILDKVWGLDFDPGSNVVDVYVRQLRRKLGAQHITTVRGVGYRCG